VPWCVVAAADALLNNLVVCLKPMSKLLVKLYAVIMLYYSFSGVCVLPAAAVQPGGQYNCGSTVSHCRGTKTAALGQLHSLTSIPCATCGVSMCHNARRPRLTHLRCCCYFAAAAAAATSLLMLLSSSSLLLLSFCSACEAEEPWSDEHVGA
jgi:hypothetical protein